MAKVREERGSLAAGGGGWGKGRSSNRTTKAPKSFLWAAALARLRLLRRVSVRITTPAARPIPSAINSLGLEALACITFTAFDMEQGLEVEGGFFGGFWEGFRHALDFWTCLFIWVDALMLLCLTEIVYCAWLGQEARIFYCMNFFLFFFYWFLGKNKVKCFEHLVWKLLNT